MPSVYGQAHPSGRHPPAVQGQHASEQNHPERHAQAIHPGAFAGRGASRARRWRRGTWPERQHQDAAWLQRPGVADRRRERRQRLGLAGQPLLVVRERPAPDLAVRLAKRTS